LTFGEGTSVLAEQQERPTFQSINVVSVHYSVSSNVERTSNAEFIIEQQK